MGHLPGSEAELGRRLRAGSDPSVREALLLALVAQGSAAAGATGWIVKPVEREALPGVVRQVLPGAQAARSRPAQTSGWPFFRGLRAGGAVQPRCARHSTVPSA